jgi:glycerate 2-kinase
MAFTNTLHGTIKHELECIYRAALAAIDPARLVGRALDGEIAGVTELPALIAKVPRVFVFAIGKASRAMAAEIERRLGKKLAAGLIVAPPGESVALPSGSRLRLVSGGHPLPDANSEGAAREALTMLSALRADDLVLTALSGGASAMFAAPAEGLTLDDKIAVTAGLLRAGAPIREFNMVRKHLSTVKGGQLVRAVNGARLVSLILSDVPGNDLATIGSGLTAPDPSTFADAIAILKRRGIWGRAPERVREHFERGYSGEIPETPKTGDPLFARVTNVIVGDNGVALDAAAAAARGAGYIVERGPDLAGEADELGRSLAAQLAANFTARLCVLAGGEPVVTVRGGGRGGRAQQCALAIAIELGRSARDRQIAVLIAGTDGNDGPTDAAGAFAFTDTVSRAAARGLDAPASLRRNDAYNFFHALDDLFITGPTGTNVTDVFIALSNY